MSSPTFLGPVLACDKAVLSQASRAPAAVASLAEAAREYVEQARAANTLRAYRSDWRRFEGWCLARGTSAIPAAPTTVAFYLTDHATSHQTSSLERWLTSIGQAHQAAGHVDPTKAAPVKSVWRGICRTHGTAQRGKTPILVSQLRRMAEAIPDTLLGLRDRALLLLGFAGGLRRSDLVALELADVTEVSEGLVVEIRRSKTDQEGVGRQIGIPYGSDPATCPVRAVRRWRDTMAGMAISSGPLLRAVNRHGRVAASRLSGFAVALVVKKLAAQVGIDPAKVAGHSLRAGLATSAAAAGVNERDIMRQTGHRSVEVLRKYIREGSLFRGNAAAAIGL